MAMLLTLLGMSAIVFVLSVSCLKAALAPDRSRTEMQPGKKLGIDSQFFAGDVAALPITSIPREVLLRQIEQHVRLEQAVAENYLEIPTRETLQAPAASQFVN